MKNWRMVLFAFLLAIVFLITTVFHYILLARHSLQSEETSEILAERV